VNEKHDSSSPQVTGDAAIDKEQISLRNAKTYKGTFMKGIAHTEIAIDPATCCRRDTSLLKSVSY
jgi:hypothetical protein